MTVRFAAALPKEAENNGLTSIERALVDTPGAQHLIIGVVDTRKVIIDADEDDTIPYARFVHVEVIKGADEPAARALLDAATAARTGGQQLQLDGQDDADADDLAEDDEDQDDDDVE
jgi:phosphopantothenoylcysteine synthetase/decarboxylase